jgi:hypothetical protein
MNNNISYGNALNIMRKGKVYLPASSHYINPHAVVICDNCNQTNLGMCVGWGSQDLCMECVVHLGKTYDEKRKVVGANYNNIEQYFLNIKKYGAGPKYNWSHKVHDPDQIYRHVIKETNIYNNRSSIPVTTSVAPVTTVATSVAVTSTHKNISIGTQTEHPLSTCDAKNNIEEEIDYEEYEKIDYDSCNNEEPTEE